MTGKKNWEVPGSTTECVTSVISDGTLLITSGGYPDKHIAVMKADGSGQELWRNTNEVYVPSMLLKDGHIYGVTDRGQAFCYSLNNPQPLWEERLRAKFAASPTLVGDTIYATDTKGTTHIFKANPKQFESVSTNTITADEIEATPTIIGNAIYIRAAQKQDNTRQEYLYCIGE